MKSFLLMCLVMVMMACGQQPKVNKNQLKAVVAATVDTARPKSDTTADSLTFIKNTFKHINATPLDSVVYTFQCDEKTTVKRYLENGKTVKVTIDWNAVGDAYEFEEFYYDNNQVIFIYRLLEGVGACENCDFRREGRSYIKDNRMFLYTENGIKKPAKLGSVDDQHLAYRILQAENPAQLKAALCK